MVELPDRTLLLPLCGAYDRRGAWTCGLVKSTDNGETWGNYRRIVQGKSDETPIILLPNSRVLALIRGHSDDPSRPFHVSHSSDGGASWQFQLQLDPIKGPWHYGGYPVLTNLADGRILVTFHNAAPRLYVAYNVLEEISAD